jgi:hypothetical protein
VASRIWSKVWGASKTGLLLSKDADIRDTGGEGTPGYMAFSFLEITGRKVYCGLLPFQGLMAQLGSCSCNFTACFLLQFLQHLSVPSTKSGPHISTLYVALFQLLASCLQGARAARIPVDVFK